MAAIGLSYEAQPYRGHGRMVAPPLLQRYFPSRGNRYQFFPAECFQRKREKNFPANLISIVDLCDPSVTTTSATIRKTGALGMAS